MIQTLIFNTNKTDRVYITLYGAFRMLNRRKLIQLALMADFAPQSFLCIHWRSRVKTGIRTEEENERSWFGYGLRIEVDSY